MQHGENLSFYDARSLHATCNIYTLSGINLRAALISEYIRCNRALQAATRLKQRNTGRRGGPAVTVLPNILHRRLLTRAPSARLALLRPASNPLCDRSPDWPPDPLC